MDKSKPLKIGGNIVLHYTEYRGSARMVVSVMGWPC